MNLPKIFDVSKTIPDLHTNISRKFLMPEKIGKTLLYNSKTKLYSGVALIMRFMWHAISREEITDITLGDWLENEKLFKAKFFNHTSIKILNSFGLINSFSLCRESYVTMYLLPL